MATTKHVLGTLISWMGVSANSPISMDETAKLLAMLSEDGRILPSDPASSSDRVLLDEAMELHEAIATGGTGQLLDQRRRLIQRWKKQKK